MVSGTKYVGSMQLPTVTCSSCSGARTNSSSSFASVTPTMRSISSSYTGMRE